MMLGLSTSMTLDEGPLSRGVAPIQGSLLYEEVLSAATFASLECGASVLQTLWKVRKPTAGPPAGPPGDPLQEPTMLHQDYLQDQLNKAQAQEPKKGQAKKPAAKS